MAEEEANGNTLPEVNKSSSQNMSKFGDTALAFDDMIVQVGRGISRAQELMDNSQVEFQKKVARAFSDGKIKRLDLNPSNAYTIPETSLDIKVGMSMSYPENGDEPTLSAVPLNASTTNENDINVEAATEIKLKFVSVPASKEPPGPSPSALRREEALAMAMKEYRVKAIVNDGNYTMLTDYAEDARLWRIIWLKAKEPEITVFIDDRKGKILDVIYRIYPPSLEEMAPVGEPVLKKAVPGEGKRGEYIVVSGDNFLTLSGQTILTVDGQPIPLIRHSMKEIMFKIPAWAVRGDVEIITPFGRTGESGNALFNPLPSFNSFQPTEGNYDTHRMKGTRLTVRGDNLRPGCNVRFATGALGKNVTVLSPGLMELEVPEDAGTGPLTLVSGDYTQALAVPFIMLHSIHSFVPKQAKVGDKVLIKGARLGAVEEIVIGKSTIQVKYPKATEIEFQVPPDAHDGRIILREKSGNQLIETTSRDRFYVVPRITGFGNGIVTRGEVLIIKGEGLDADPQMMSIIFEGSRGISQTSVLDVSGDRQSLTVRVPKDAVSGYVRLIRKRVYSGAAAEDTSSLSLNKITVLTLEGLSTDVLLEERFDNDLSLWNPASGNWKIDQSTLVSEGVGLLTYVFSEAFTELYVHADVLNAGPFGFKLFFQEENVLPLQLWIDLNDTASSFSWSRDNGGSQTELGATKLTQFSGNNYHAQLKITSGKIIICIDQAVVQSIDWPHAIAKIGLLSNSDEQRWDNVLFLKRDSLVLPQPDYYRFGEVPKLSALPVVTLDAFQPEQGPIGTKVSLSGSGFNHVKAFYFGGVKAELENEKLNNLSAVVIVPKHAISGPVEAEVRGGVRISSGDLTFTLPPQITNIFPAKALAYSELHIIGINLPSLAQNAKVVLLGTEARVLSTSPTMITVKVPDVSGKGPVSISSSGFTTTSSIPLEIVRETVIVDLIADAEKATWSTGGGQLQFGLPGEASQGLVDLRNNERMEDDNSYNSLLYVHPPAPSYRALRAVYPVISFPEGQLELRLQLGMLWSAAPTPDDITEADGVLFEISFLPVGEEEINLLPRSACIHDGSMETYMIDANDIASKKGQLIVSVFPGRSGLRDDAAIVFAKLIRIL